MCDKLPTVGGAWAARWALAVRLLETDTPFSLHFIVQDVRQDASARRLFDDYCGDLSGRFIDAASWAELASGQPSDKLRAVVDLVLAEQRQDGHFGHRVGRAGADHGSAWGNGRLLEGLITYSGIAQGEHQRAVDVAIIRLAHSIADDVPMWTTWWADEANRRLKFGLDMLSALLPMVEAYRRVGDPRLLEAAESLAAMVTSSGDFHTHGYLLAIRGLLELATVTGSKEHLDHVRAACAEVRASFTLPNGAVYESLNTPHDVSAEGCAAADWLMLNLRLAEVTGEPMYLDLAEHVLHNALFHMQRPSGHFGCETIAVGEAFLTFDFAPEAWWCCTFHGIRALHAVRERIITAGQDRLVVNLIMEAVADVVVAGSQVRLTLETTFPADGRVRLAIEARTPTHFSLQVRVPGYATVESLVVDGDERQPRIERGYLIIDREWNGSSVVELTLGFGLRLRSHEQDFLRYGGNTTDVEGFAVAPVSLFWGPLLQAADGRHNDLNDLLRARRVEIGHRHEKFIIGRDGPHRFRTRAIGLDTFSAEIVLTALGDQTFYDHDVSSMIVFPEARFVEAAPERHPEAEEVP